MNFISCVKTISMSINVETLPFLVTEYSDIPLLVVANTFRAAILAKMGFSSDGILVAQLPLRPAKLRHVFPSLVCDVIVTCKGILSNVHGLSWVKMN